MKFFDVWVIVIRFRRLVMSAGKPLDPEWKKKVTEDLKTLGLMKPDFTGQMVIDCNQGGITVLTISEKIR
jgi:hypothetical protein